MNSPSALSLDVIFYSIDEDTGQQEIKHFASSNHTAAKPGMNSGRAGSRITITILLFYLLQKMREDDALLIYKCHTQPRIIKLVAKGLYTEDRVIRIESDLESSPSTVLNLVVVDQVFCLSVTTVPILRAFTFQ